MDATRTAPPPAPARSDHVAWSWHNGRIVPTSQATVPLSTQALQYGTGVFEGIRAYAVPGRDELVVFRMHDHYRRFLRSCRLLRIEIPYSAGHLADATVDLLRRVGRHTDVYLRPLGYKLALGPGTRPGVSLGGITDAVSVSAYAMGDYAPAGGLRCAISSWRRPPNSVMPVQAKLTGAYVNSALALDEAREAGLDDAILLNERGTVAEATTSNVFAVTGDRLVTPPVTADILEGITRDTVRVLATELGLTVDVRDLHRSELLLADEVFLTGTGLGIAPVVALAGREIGDGAPGPVTTGLADRYRSLVRGGLGDGRGWLTRVALDRATTTLPEEVLP